MKKQDKSVLIEKLTKNFKEAKSISLVDFTGMDIVAQQDLKKRLREATSKMIVAKNTLIKRALDEAKLPKELTDKAILSGQTAVVIGLNDLNADGIAPIQTIGKFATENEALKFKAGILEGLFQDKNAMIAISKLPSKEVLNGQIVAAVVGPMYSLINNLENKMQELFYILGAR
jgi:large subunit ribosomal protein L10